MKIIVDGFGGDHAPQSVLEGCAAAVAEYGVSIVLTGDEKRLREAAAAQNLSLDGMTFAHTESVITNDDNPVDILKTFSDCSMALGLRMLAEGEGDAFVSAGSTGALVVGASMITKRIKGVKRCALGTVLPNEKGCSLLLDVGANVECRPEMLAQFAHMGAFYMEKVMGVANPSVGLVNIGAEESKGLDLQVETYQLLKNSSLRFLGNVEGRDIPLGAADVLVADGFTGNIVLKTVEGMGKYMGHMLKGLFYKSALTKVGALFVKQGIAEAKAKMDYTEYGGAPLLGIAKPVIKAHGSSNGYALKNAVRQALRMCENDVVGAIADYARQSRASAES